MWPEFPCDVDEFEPGVLEAEGRLRMRIGVWKAVTGGGATVDVVLDDEITSSGMGARAFLAVRKADVADTRFNLLQRCATSRVQTTSLTYASSQIFWLSPSSSSSSSSQSSGTDCAGTGHRNMTFERLEACRRIRDQPQAKLCQRGGLGARFLTLTDG